jgi:hypothetical protein
MDPSRENPQEYLRQAIDAEIKSLEGSIRALRHRRNALAPVSSLPTEVITAIFSFLRLPGSSTLGGKPDHLEWLRVAHVCYQWRDIALNLPLFWSHVDFTTVTLAGAAEILARAKKAPLHLMARLPDGDIRNIRFSAFELELHTRVSYIRHLTISADSSRLRMTLKGLVSPAPMLEYLSLTHPGPPWQQEFVPDTLFDGTTPRLSCLELYNNNISWKSPLLKGLKILEMHTPSPNARPSIDVWIDALDEMPQLRRLVLHSASPSSPDFPFDVERTVTLPSLTHLEISDTPWELAFALAHLILPALTSLCVIPKHSLYDSAGTDMQNILPYVARHAHGPQDTEPFQSILFRNDINCIEILAWTLPDVDVELPNLTACLDAMHSARVAFFIMNDDEDWIDGFDMKIFDAVMESLPLDGLATLTVQNRTRTLDEQFWLRHVPRWPLLRCIRLSPYAWRGFRGMLLEDNVGCESPLLPSLTKLALINTALCPRRTLRLCDALMKRVEQGVPLETLDLRTCLSSSRVIELLSEIVVDVLGPEETLKTGAKILSASIAREICLEDSSGTEDYDEDEPDTGSDDVVRDIWEIDDDECEYKEDEHEYDEDEYDEDEEDHED